MTRETPEELLADFRTNKKNRTIDEAIKLLRAHGWKIREAKKEGYVCSHGSLTLTLPDPHGRDPSLLLPYVSRIIRYIDQAKMQTEAPSDE